MNWTKHNEKLNGLYKGNNIGFYGCEKLINRK